MYKVKVADSASGFICGEAQSILDAARSQGVKISWGCNGGGCGMCKIKVEAGNFERGTSSKAALPDEERALNYTLACKTYPRSDIKVSIL